MKAEDLHWAAGIFEGEGTVTINKNSSTNNYSLRCSVPNTDKSIIDFFNLHWPVKKVREEIGYGNRRTCYVWILTGKKATSFLQTLLPCLRTERVKNKAVLALDFQRHKYVRRVSVRDEYDKEEEEYYQRMKLLNRKGP